MLFCWPLAIEQKRTPHTMADLAVNDLPGDEKVRPYEGGQWEIDKAKEKKLVRKLDLFIVPPVMLLYLLSFLDRYNSRYSSSS